MHGDSLPQELYRWQVVSEALLSLGESVSLGHIPVVVTGVERQTRQGRVVYTYELSRRKGIFRKKQYNPALWGMSLPATIQERKGNQVRLKLDLVRGEETPEDTTWFTYAIETSNFYCMPEVGSRVHLYFPDQDEANAMAVHALRAEGEQRPKGTGTSGGGPNAAPVGSGILAGSGGEPLPGNGGGPFGGSNRGIPVSSKSAALGEEESPLEEEEEVPEKDPSHKLFSHPGGSFLQLAPAGVTLSSGKEATLAMTESGIFSLQGKRLTLDSQGTLLIGTGKGGKLPQMYFEARETLTLSLRGKDSRLVFAESAQVMGTFIKKEASSRRLARPYSTEVRAQVMEGDEALREGINRQVQDSLMEGAMAERERLLAEKEAAAEAKVREGIFSLLTVVASVAVVVATGGAAAPLVAAMAVTGGFKAVSAVADIAEGLSDLEKVEAGELSPSYNFMRDGVFQGNEGLYQGVKGVNDTLFGLVTGKAVAGNLAKLEKLEDAAGLLKKVQQGQKLLKDNRAVKAALNITSEAGMGMVEEYVATGTVHPGNVVANIASGGLKGFGMQKLTLPCGSPMNNLVRKTANTLSKTAVGTGVDWLGSKLTNQPFNLRGSLQQNLVVAALGEMVGEPIDVVSGAFLLTATDLRLADIRQELALTRQYASTRQEGGWFGRGWQFPYESRLYREGERIHLTLPMGLKAAFLVQEKGEGIRTYEDTLGNGRFGLTYVPLKKGWQVEDRHTHTRCHYDEAGRLLWVEDKNHQRTTLFYEGDYPSRMVTALGYTLSFTFKGGKLTSLKDPTGRTLHYAYEGEYLTQVTHPEGGVSRYAYDDRGYLSQPTDQTGLTYLTNHYDEGGRVLLQTLANGDTYRLAYDDRKRQVQVEYSAYPGITTYLYQKEDQAIREIHHADGTKTLYGYDGRGNRILFQDRLGRKTRWAYDGAGRLLRHEGPGGLITTYTYNEGGDLTEIADNGGRKKWLAYDGCHNLIRLEEKLSGQESALCRYAYDEKGRLLSETDGEGNKTSYLYDEDSAYPKTTTYADGTVLHCTYSETGRKLKEEDGAVSFTYGYNPGGYRTFIRDGEGNETRYHYDGMGRHVSTYTPKQLKEGEGKRTRYRYDFLERLVETIHPDDTRELLFRDGEGNIVKKVHPNAYDPKTGDGEGTRYRYNRDHQLLAIHYPDGGTERFIRDGAGNRIKHILPEQYDPATDDGAGYGYTYDAEDRLTRVTGPSGEVVAAYVYDRMGNCIERKDALGGCHYYAYDLRGKRIRELHPLGEGGQPQEARGPQPYQRTDYRYDKNGNRIQEIRYGGSYTKEGQLLQAGKDLTLTFAYDARNRLIQIQDSTGARVTYGYDARGNRLRQEQGIEAGKKAQEGEAAEGCPGGKRINYAYDRAGRLVRKRELLDSGIAGEKKVWAETAYAYDENGNCIRIRTPEGYVLHRFFDDRDRLAHQVLEDRENDIRLLTRFSYDRGGNLIQVVQQGREGQRELSCTYDLKDRLTGVKELGGPVFGYGYDRNDNRIQQKRRLPLAQEAYAVTRYHYDLRGNLVGQEEGGSLRAEYAYDAAGHRTKSRDGDGVEVSLSYGLEGQIRTLTTERAREAGRISQRFAYDARGRITGLEEAGETSTSFSLDHWGRITAIHAPEGGKEEYTYDAAGNLRTSKAALGGVVSYTYTSRGQVASRRDQFGHTEYFQYDKEGRQVVQVDRKGNRTQTRFNVYGKPVYQACTDRKGKRQVMGIWAYDDFGHLKEAKGGGFTYTYRHRPDGRLLEKTRNGKVVLTCTYYPEGTLRSLTDHRGKTLYYTYDGEGRQESLKTQEGQVLARYTYTPGGRLATIESGNGIITRYTYDGEGNLSGLSVQKGEAWLLYAAAFTYDLRGNRLTKRGQRLGEGGRREALAVTYTYDGRNRLLREERPEGGEEYAYDQNGNRREKTHYHYAWIEEAGAVCPVIDFQETCCYNEGNQLTRRSSFGETTDYTYDANGSLVKETTVSPEGSGGKKEEKETFYHYDLLNRQVRVEGPEGRSTESHYDGEGLRAGLTTGKGESYTFLYHQGELMGEEREGSFWRRYLRGNGLVSLETEDQKYHSCHLDEQGSTLYLTDGQAEVENRYAYDAFGNLLGQEEAFPNRILYAGQPYDQETGQYYLRARYYNPTIGRFSQEDTYWGDGLNLYAYCANNPVRYFDPSGHQKKPNCPGTEGEAATDKQPGVEIESGSKTYKNSSDITKDIRQNKPLNSPAIDASYGKNGTISMDENGVWTYHDWEGNSVSYPNGYPDFKSAGMVRQEAPIGPFVERNKDFAKAREMGYIKSADGTWHHHEDGVTLQEVETILHDRFRHRGGISNLKKK